MRTREVTDMWINEIQPFGKNMTHAYRNYMYGPKAGDPPNGSVFFEGPIIYSYGSHYPMATITHPSPGLTIVFVNSEKTTPTTQGHLWYVKA